MKYTLLITLFLLVLFIAACGSTGSTPRAPPQPSGGGCGIAAPAETDSPTLGDTATAESLVM